MANTFIPKRSTVAGKVPQPADLQIGELAVNLTDRKIYTKDANSAVVLLNDMSSAGFAAGTRLAFAQASAPTGWTQDTTDAATNRMLRVVNTAGGGTGGSHSPILNNVVPAHTHGFTTGTESADHTHSGWTGGTNTNHTHAQAAMTYGDYASGSYANVGGGNRYMTAASFDGAGRLFTDGQSVDHSHYITTGGKSATHTHSGSTDNGSSQTNWTPRYIDLIICTKN